MPKRYEHEEGTNMYRLLGRTPAQKRADAIIHFERGRCAELNENYKSAEIFYRSALADDPTHAGTCINLGTIYYNRRNFKKARRCYRRAVASAPDWALAWFDLGNALDETKLFGESVKCYRRAVELDPLYADAHFNLALAYRKQGEIRKALEHFRIYVTIDDPGTLFSRSAQCQIEILKRQDLQVVTATRRVTVVA
jgi:tetratricopeptide (TPR) repeat protein